MKWLLQRCFGEDEATMVKARRLLRIRNQATKALQQELESMSASSSDPIGSEKKEGVADEPLSEGTTRLPSRTQGPATATTREDDQDLRAAITTARIGDFQRLRTSFVMSEYGDRLHVVADCHGLRHANKLKLRRLQICHYCDSKYPLSYRALEGRMIPEG